MTLGEWAQKYYMSRLMRALLSRREQLIEANDGIEVIRTGFSYEAEWNNELGRFTFKRVAGGGIGIINRKLLYYGS